MNSLLRLAPVPVLLALGCNGSAGDVIVRRGPDASCTAAAQALYLIDDDGRLARFRSSPFGVDEIATLSCPLVDTCAVGGPSAVLAVDRAGNGWALGCSGQLYRIDLATGGCATTPFTQQPGFDRFSMAFMSGAGGAAGETLFIAGGDATRIFPGPASSRFGTLDLSTLEAKQIGTLEGWPDLTSTADGELWGFFRPGVSGSARLAQIDPRTGADMRTLSAPAASWPVESGGFAFWGGEFWTFRALTAAAGTVVSRLSRQDGAYKWVGVLAQRRIVAAAVSICAPLVIS